MPKPSPKTKIPIANTNHKPVETVFGEGLDNPPAVDQYLQQLVYKSKYAAISKCDGYDYVDYYGSKVCGTPSTYPGQALTAASLKEGVEKLKKQNLSNPCTEEAGNWPLSGGYINSYPGMKTWGLGEMQSDYMATIKADESRKIAERKRLIDRDELALFLRDEISHYLGLKADRRTCYAVAERVLDFQERRAGPEGNNTLQSQIENQAETIRHLYKLKDKETSEARSLRNICGVKDATIQHLNTLVANLKAQIDNMVPKVKVKQAGINISGRKFQEAV